MARTVRKVFQSQALRDIALALILPTLVVAPGQAGVLLLHRHCDDSSTHFHRSHHADLDAWRRDHAGQHPCEGSGHSAPHESDAIVGDAECNHDTPILVLPLTNRLLSRPVGSCGSATLGLSLSVSATLAALPTAPKDALSGEPPPPSFLRPDLATLDATAALLLRNHALLF